MSTSYIGRALERVELVRTNLRWTTSLDKTGIQKILNQLNQVRNELLFLSRQEKIKTNVDFETVDTLHQRIKSKRKRALEESNFSFTGVFGENPRLLTVLETLNKAASSDFPVLIEGESGTGKELMAKLVHSNSDRSAKPFISVNCGAIPNSLIESELFGHVKGAFTGAEKTRIGRFELADGGVLFLDELGELSLDNQVKLLRALQTGEIQRVGTDNPIQVDVRIVAATNKKLYQMMTEGAFREDLYYRLGVVTVTIPPLRDRKDEIPILIDYFLKEAADRLDKKPVRLSPRLQKFLNDYNYRGNIRELQNIIYRVSCLAEHIGGLRHLPDNIRPRISNEQLESNKSSYVSLDTLRSSAKDIAEEQFLFKHLKKHNGKVTEMAASLQMNRSYLQTLMKKHGFYSKDFKQKNLTS